MGGMSSLDALIWVKDHQAVVQWKVDGVVVSRRVGDDWHTARRRTFLEAVLAHVSGSAGEIGPMCPLCEVIEARYCTHSRMEGDAQVCGECGEKVR